MAEAPSRRREQGFTLLELMVVFAIMALIVGVVPLAFDRMREAAQYRNTVRTMISDMRVARQQALSGRGETRFTVNLQQKSYGINGGTVRDLPEAVRVRVTVAGSEMNSGAASIRFLSDGGATGGSVDVLRGDSAGVRLRVDWLSGRVSQEPLSP